MAKPGRPTNLTPEVQEEVCNAIRAGNYMETAAAFAGIDKTTLHDWMRRGAREIDRLEKDPKATPNKDEAKFVEFRHSVKKALAEAEIRDVLTIGKAAEGGQWQAAAWRLERKFPDKWAKREHKPQAADTLKQLAEMLEQARNEFGG